ncbi:MAG: TonB-dependent receptor [Pyrinomonadaceae bacterium]
MKTTRLFVFTAIFAVSIFGQSTASVTGYIGRIVPGNEKGIPYSNVTITLRLEAESSASFTSVTNGEGNYRFQNVPPGRYVISVLPPPADGTQTPSETIDVADGDAVRKDFSLSSIAVPNCTNCGIRETVTISADTLQPVEAVSKTVNVITGQEMRDRADITLVDSLRTIPGFRIQQLGGFGRTASVKSRGLRNQDTAVLIDGIRFRDPASITGDATAFLSDLTLTSVRKVEVLRGPGSSLYGTNAVGGTVDFQTPNVRSGTHGQIAGALGGLGLGRFRGLVSHGLDNGKFGIGAGLSRTVYSKGIDGEDDAHNTNFQTRVDANPFVRTNISGRIFFSDADVRLNVNPDTLGTLPTNNATIIDAQPGVNFTPDANDPDAMQRSRFFSGQISVSQVITSDMIVRGYYQGLTTRRRNDDGPLGPGFQSAFSSIFDGQAHTANSHVTWSAGGVNTLTAGYEFEHETFDNEGGTPSGTDEFFTRARQSSNMFYVQDLVSLLDGRLQLSGAFRSQWFSLRRPQCSDLASCPTAVNNTAEPPASYTGDASAAYYFKKTGTKLRAHVGNGYRVPSLYERFGTYFFFGGFFPLGNPQLKPERSFGLDGGVDQSFASDRVRLTATYFYTKIRDEVAFLPTDDFGAPSYYNFDKHFSRGAEFSASLKLTDSTDVFASYTFTNSDIRNHRRQALMPPYNIVSTDRTTFGIPSHQFTFNATQRIKRFWVNADFLAESSYIAPIFSNSTFSTYIYRFGGNRRMDLTAGYTFSMKNDKLNLRVFGTLENLFDHEYFENGFRTIGRTGRVGINFGF